VPAGDRQLKGFSRPVMTYAVAGIDEIGARA
jgi:class 3 adenylate cyclase